MARYLPALVEEAAMLELEPGSPLTSLYLGGGTPSQVPPQALASLVEELCVRFPLAPGAEVTVEANPDDVTATLLDAWRGAGVTRVSMGVQSFDDGELAVLDRRHDAARAASAARLALDHGDLEVSLDLMLAIPDQTRSSLDRSVDRLLDLAPHHVSVYLLEMDKPHRLRALARRQPERFAGDEEAADLYLHLAARLGGAGYLHYEVSNFARPGHEAVHNTRYWSRRAVHALGVAAHGQEGPRRWANVDALREYLSAVEAGRRPLAWTTTLDPEAEAAEAVMLGLRLAEGVPRALVDRVAAARPAFAERLADFRNLGLAEEDDDAVSLTPRGWLLSNELFQELT